MSQGVPATPAPVSLEGYAWQFNNLLCKLNQRQLLLRYLKGLLLPRERNWADNHSRATPF